jgi:hypothetical protein
MGVLIPLYAVVALMIFAAQSRHGETWRACFESLLHPIPVLGVARRYLALARLAAALEALLSAGVTIIEAWELAAHGKRFAGPATDGAGWRPQVNGGQTPAEAVTASGKLSRDLCLPVCDWRNQREARRHPGRLHAYYQEEGSRKLHAFSRWTPRAIYFCIVLMIAYRIVHFYVGYFNMVKDAGGF